MSGNEEVEKFPQVDIKDMKEQDWRGVITVMMVSIFGAALLICLLRGDMTAIEKVIAFGGWFLGPVLGFYFGVKNGNSA